MKHTLIESGTNHRMKSKPPSEARVARLLEKKRRKCVKSFDGPKIACEGNKNLKNDENDQQVCLKAKLT